MNNGELNITHQKHFKSAAEIKENFSQAQKFKLAKASRDFESMLTSMMLKSMTKTTGGLFGEDNYGGGMLDTLFEQEIAGYMTKSNGLGIAEIIYKKITGEDLGVLEKIKLQNKIEQTDKSSVKTGEIQDEKYNETNKEINKEGSQNIDDIQITPGPVSLQRLHKLSPYIKEASQKFGVEENLIKSIILTESAANPYAVSKSNAKGVMQLMDSTATEMGVKNIWNPRENILGGTKYFAKMLRQYNWDIRLALAAYNAGPGNVDKYNGVPPFKETQSYLTRVLGYLNNLES